MKRRLVERIAENWLSSSTIVLLTKEIFENWIRVVNKNQNTKPIKQSSK
jgi:hypothetical protein